MSQKQQPQVRKSNLQIHVPRQEWQVLLSVIQRAAGLYGECSWFGIGREPTKGNEVHIDRIAYPEQENSTAASDIDDLAMANLLSSLAEDERILWWGHSHGNMGAYYSSKDEETWKNWMAESPRFFLGTCHNVRGETFQRVCCDGLVVDLADHPFRVAADEGLEARIEEAMSEMYKPKPTSYAPTAKTTQTARSWNDYGKGLVLFQNPSKHILDSRVKDLEEGKSKEGKAGYRKKSEFFALEFLIPNLLTNFLKKVEFRNRNYIELTFEADLAFPVNKNVKTQLLILGEEWITDLIRLGAMHGLMDDAYDHKDPVEMQEFRTHFTHMLLYFSEYESLCEIFPWLEISQGQSAWEYVFGDTDFTEAGLCYHTAKETCAESMLLYTGQTTKDFDEVSRDALHAEIVQHYWLNSPADFSTNMVEVCPMVDYIQ